MACKPMQAITRHMITRHIPCMQGPMVHIGACVASVVTYLDCSEYQLSNLRVLRPVLQSGFHMHQGQQQTVRL